MDRLIHWSLEQRFLVLVGAIGLLVAGLRATWTAPVDVFPDLTAPTVTVLTEAPSLAVEDLELRVTAPIERALQGARGLRRLRSKTAVGISVINAEFAWGTDQPWARQIVTERLRLVAKDFAQDIEAPVLAPVTSILGEVSILGLQGEGLHLYELHALAERRVRRRLLAVPGVAEVTMLGGARKEYQAWLEPDRLLAHGVSVGDVATAVEANSRQAGAGWIETGGSRFQVTTAGRLEGLRDLAAVPIPTPGGGASLGELGSVRIDSAPRLGDAAVNAEPAILLSVLKQPGIDTLRLSEDLRVALDELSESLPAGVTIYRDLFQQRDFIDRAIQNVSHALRDGSILVVIIMLLFLASLRASLITLLAIPLSLAAAVIAMAWIGLSIDTMTLGGLAIAIGALVDDAVIDVENVVRRLREHRARHAKTEGEGAGQEVESSHDLLDVVLRASLEIRPSIAFATLIVVLVFVPLFFLAGIEGRLLLPLGLAYILALFASLLVALTVTPVLCYYLLPTSRVVRAGREPRSAQVLKRLYGTTLDRVLPYPKLVISAALALIAVAVFGSLNWGQAFLPEFNEGDLTITAGTAPGTGLQDSAALGAVVEAQLLALPEVRSVARLTGRSENSEHVQGFEESEYEVRVTPGERSREEFLEALRKDLALVPGVNPSVGQPLSHRIDHMLSGTEANIAVKLFGPDLQELRVLGKEVEHAMEGVEGAVDVRMDPQTDVPVVRIEPDREALRRYGPSVADAAILVASSLSGHPVASIYEEGVDVDVRLRLEGEHDVASLGSLPVQLPTGGTVPLAQVAHVARDLAPNRVTRERGRRLIVVQANVAGRDVVSVVEDMRARVDPLVRAKPGYEVEYGGQFESAAEASRRILLASLAVLIAVATLLHLAFGSLRDTLLVLANLPLCLAGGVAGVWLSGGVLSIASLIGFIAVFGISTRNGILLISHFRHLRLEEGVEDRLEIVRRGARERLIPVLMTALGTALALVPLALRGDQPGNEIQSPMAVVILAGLVSSTLLNLIVIPVLYLRYGAGMGEER